MHRAIIEIDPETFLRIAIEKNLRATELCELVCRHKRQIARYRKDGVPLLVATIFMLQTGEHPGFKLDPAPIELIKESPKPECVIAARANAGMTLAQVAELLGLAGQSAAWNWEAGARQMNPLTWNMLLLFTDQHPHGRLKPRARIDEI